MIGPLAFGLLFLVAVGALAIQHAYWSGRFERLTAKRRADNADWLADVEDAQMREMQALGKLRKTQAVVEALTNDLAQAHRANMLLRTGILDAEREANEMAQVLALPIELSERRAAR